MSYDEIKEYVVGILDAPKTNNEEKAVQILAFLNINSEAEKIPVKQQPTE